MLRKHQSFTGTVSTYFKQAAFLRFAASEVSTPAFRNRAIALVVCGGAVSVVWECGRLWVRGVEMRRAGPALCSPWVSVHLRGQPRSTIFQSSLYYYVLFSFLI